jgi:aminobenzoyl-glutamate utilization protein B
MVDEAKQVALDWVNDNQRLVTEIHDKLWNLAEVGLQEIETSKILTKVLKDNDFRVEEGVAGMPSAFVATYGTGKPVIGVMGELDALPGLSQKAVPYRDVLREGAPGHG